MEDALLNMIPGKVKIKGKGNRYCYRLLFGFFLLWSTHAFPQAPVCDHIYLLRGNKGIYNFNPALPVSTANPVLNTISVPRSYGGLTVSPVLGSGSTDLTFYSTESRFYVYYDPVTATWVNTGHRCSVPNIAAGGDYIFGLDGPRGDVYRYDGKGNDTLITRIEGWTSSCGPYDLIADCAGNWYALNSFPPVGFLKKYNSSGKLMQSWVVVNPLELSPTVGVGGFAIIGATLYANAINFDTPRIVVYSMGKDTITAVREILDSFASSTMSTSPFQNNYDMGSCASGVPTVPEVAITVTDTVVCAESGPVTFTAVPNGGGTAPIYEWRVNGSIVAGTGPELKYVPSDGDKVSCMMRSNAVCVTASIAYSNVVAIKVLDLPPAPNIGNNGPVCAGDSVSVFVTPKAGALYAWTGPGGFRATGAVQSFVSATASAGLYTVSALVGKCSSHQVTTNLIVHPLPSKQYFTEKDICEGDDLLIAPLQETNTTYSWRQASGSFSVAAANLTIRAIRVPQSGQYVLRSVSAFGCKREDSIQVNVYPKTSLEIPADTAICSGDSIKLIATTNSAMVYWTSEGMSESVSKNLLVRPAIKSVYRILVKAMHESCRDTAGSVTVDVLPLPELRGFDTIVQVSAQVHLSPYYSPGIVKWLWSPADNLSCIHCPDPVLNFTQAVSYTVFVADHKGCTAAGEVTIGVMCDAAITMPNAFTPNGDGRNDVFYVRGHGFTVKSFRIYNRYGQEVFSRSDFQPDNEQYGWTGTANGQPISETAGFVYVVEANCNNNKRTLTAQGSILMIK